MRGLPALVEIAIAAADVARPARPPRSSSSSSDAYKTGDRRAPAFDATVHFALGQFRLSEPRVTSLKGFGEPMEVERTPLVARLVARFAPWRTSSNPSGSCATKHH